MLQVLTKFCLNVGDCIGKTSAIIEGMEYQLFQNRQTFQDARDRCTNWGGGIDAKLAIIKKQSTQTCITQMITSDGVYKPEEWIDETEPYNRGAWIGASDMRSESNWVWEDGTQLVRNQKLCSIRQRPYHQCNLE